jgi:hypothetical protein
MFTSTPSALVFERTPRGIPWPKDFAAEGRLHCGPEVLYVSTVPLCGSIAGLLGEAVLWLAVKSGDRTA